MTTTTDLVHEACGESVYDGMVRCSRPAQHAGWHRAGGVYWKLDSDPANTLLMRCIYCAHEQPYEGWGNPAPRHCEEWMAPVNEETGR